MVRIVGVTDHSLDGTFPTPLTKTFNKAGDYKITYFAYCGEKECSKCDFILTIDKNCCLNSKWVKAQYQIINKKVDGSPDLSDLTLYNLPLSITTGIPTIKADMGLNIQNLQYQCSEQGECNAEYIIKRKNLTTGFFEPEVLLTGGINKVTVNAKQYPQMIWIQAKCGGQTCGIPLIFKLECVNKDCIKPVPCKENKQLIINTGTDSNGALLPANVQDSFWNTSKTIATGSIPTVGWCQINGARIIVPSINPTAAGDFTFTRNFNICKLGSYKFSGILRCDNQLRSLVIKNSVNAVIWTLSGIPTSTDNIYADVNFSSTNSLLPGQYKIEATYRNRNDSWGQNTIGGFSLAGTIVTKDGEVVNTQGECCSNSVVENQTTPPSLNCNNQLIANGDFTQNTVSGNMPSGSSQFWTKAYGMPIVDNSIGNGCFEDGLIKLSGNNISGSAISQNLSNQIIAGKKYKVSMGVRFINGENTLNYARLRVIAFNGLLPNSGNHPSPNSNFAIVARSGNILDCGDWSVRVFTIWTANKNYQNIAINAFTDNNTNATVRIDNITFCEVTSENCDELALDNQGNPIPPIGLQAASANRTCYSETNESYYNGSLVDLYGYNGTFDIYENLNKNECNSIGGVLPDEIKNYNCDDDLKAKGINMSCDSLERFLNAPLPQMEETIFIPESPVLPLIDCLKCQNTNTNTKVNFTSTSNMAFGGRDIIYIHGLQLDHLIKRTQLDSRAILNWPFNKSEFKNAGYYKNVAENNWHEHITHFLNYGGLKNRYFIASYNCSERADVAIYNIMNQIRDAMENGTDVVNPDETDPRKTKCFAKEFVIISHSTGGLVANLILSISNETKTNMPLQALYGNAGYIADRCKGHVALHSANGGSNLAKSCIGTALPIMLNSILLDLTPEYTFSKWGYFLNNVPKPVFTIAGGQPNNLEAFAFGVLLSGLGKPALGSLVSTVGLNLLPGIDDGVVNMESATGRNKPFFLPISQFFSIYPIKAFDIGIKLDRSIPFYLDQKRLPGFYSIPSTPYFTQTGMLEPKLSIIGMHPSFKNHYTFIQSASEHLQPSNGAYFASNNYGNMNLIGNANYEEQLVTNDNSLFNNGLIHSAIKNEMGEEIRGKKIIFTWFKIIMKNGFPKFVNYDIEFWLWKRTYHNLAGDKYDVDYAYKYLFPY